MINKISRLAWLPLLLVTGLMLTFVSTPRASADHVVIVCVGGAEITRDADPNTTDDQQCINTHAGDTSQKAVGLKFPHSLRTVTCPDGRVVTGEPGFSDEQMCASPPPATDDENTNINSPNFVKSDCQGQDISSGQPEEINGEKNPNHCGILDYLVIFINILSALIGIVIVGSIIYGGIQYSTAGSDPQKVSAAKNRIRNAIIAFIFFLFSYTILNFLVPGGVL